MQCITWGQVTSLMMTMACLFRSRLNLEMIFVMKVMDAEVMLMVLRCPRWMLPDRSGDGDRLRWPYESGNDLVMKVVFRKALQHKFHLLIMTCITLEKHMDRNRQIPESFGSGIVRLSGCTLGSKTSMVVQKLPDMADQVGATSRSDRISTSRRASIFGLEVCRSTKRCWPVSRCRCEPHC